MSDWQRREEVAHAKALSKNPRRCCPNRTPNWRAHAEALGAVKAVRTIIIAKRRGRAAPCRRGLPGARVVRRLPCVKLIHQWTPAHRAFIPCRRGRPHSPQCNLAMLWREAKSATKNRGFADGRRRLAGPPISVRREGGWL